MQVVEEQFCAQLAREDGEPLLGTATQVKTCLLLEYREPWAAKATKDNALPAAVQGHLDKHLAAIPGSRLLFIKQQMPAHESRRFFLVRTDEVAPALYKFELDGYEGLLALDLTAVAAGDQAYNDHLCEEPLFLVCTNGKRDKCCARYGFAMYTALLEEGIEDAWQSTHIGGHRYAPNTLFLPHSVNYGHLTPAEIRPAVDAYRSGQLYNLDNYRGRTYHAPAVQAADTFLRRELDLLDVTGVRLRTASMEADDIWHVSFDLPHAGEQHEIVLQISESERPYAVSCTSPAVKPVPRYRLIEHRSTIDQ